MAGGRLYVVKKLKLVSLESATRQDRLAVTGAESRNTTADPHLEQLCARLGPASAFVFAVEVERCCKMRGIPVGVKSKSKRNGEPKTVPAELP